MAEPSITTAAVATAGMLALFPGVDAGIVLGSFSGAAVFVLSSNDYPAWKKLAYLALAFFAGCLAAPTFAGLLAIPMPDSVHVPPAVGALIAAALVIKLLLWLIENAGDPLAFLDRLRGEKK